MDSFYWVGLIFWASVLVSFFLLFFSVFARSPNRLVISGIILIPSALYFAGSPVLWWVAFAPLLHFGFAFLMKRNLQKQT